MFKQTQAQTLSPFSRRHARERGNSIHPLTVMGNNRAKFCVKRVSSADTKCFRKAELKYYYFPESKGPMGLRVT